MILETLTTAVSHGGLVDAVASLPQKIANPLDGVAPNFKAFGVEFNSWWKQLIGGFWALCFVAVIGYLAYAFVEMLQHKSGAHPTQLQESRQSVVKALMALGGLAALPVLVGAVLWVAS